ncbi:hypothetical protein [Neoroseomonas soli]|uniref:Uncharacterized protein n=1 Tax=Neoroseomonas soli TaxID=1081025 RepID=A0A9X9WTS4_9PROT|nr:hypothetical protein [Neoroseomonas soli]MBR0670553.1 hypothetical protein [Neoroseomonas soli]
MLILALLPVPHGATRSHMHHFDRPASRHSGASGDGQRLASIGRRRLVVLEAGEDVVFIVHVDPVSEIPAAMLQFVDRMIGADQQFALTKRCGAIGLLKALGHAEKNPPNINGLTLRVELAYPQGSETLRPLRPKFGGGCALEPSRSAHKPRPNLRLSAVP